MNRLQSPAGTPSAKAHVPASSVVDPVIEQAVLRTNSDPGLPFSLFTPLHYERNYAYPLVVWLHGPYDDERQLYRIMPQLSMRNYAAIGPRATCLHGDDQRGYHWGNHEGAVLAAEERVFDCIDQATKKLNIASNRVFLAGFEGGGTMAFRVGLRNPHAFAGVLSVGGPFPLGQSALTNLARARRLPLFIAQGRDAEKYSVDRVCEELRLFHTAGLHVSLRQYPCGDELTTKMLRDMDVWMMEQVTGQKMVSEESPSSTSERN
jgi:phospholipase/carboxylesterase